jgi:hypothetical protein
MSPKQPTSRPTATSRQRPRTTTTSVVKNSVATPPTKVIKKRAATTQGKVIEKQSPDNQLARRLENLIKLVQRSDISYSKVNIEFLDEHLELEKYNTDTIISAITFLKNKVIKLGKESNQNVTGQVYHFDDKFQSPIIKTEVHNS